MSVEANKAIARRYVEEFLNKGNLAVADEIFATNIIFHNPLRTIHGVENAKSFVAGLRAAFPDQHFTVEDEMIGEGDKVAFRYVYRGTHQGEFQGIAPTGKQGTVAGINICQITGGRIEEIWVASDVLGLMQQLGAVPAPGQGGS